MNSQQFEIQKYKSQEDTKWFSQNQFNYQLKGIGKNLGISHKSRIRLIGISPNKKFFLLEQHEIRNLHKIILFKLADYQYIEMKPDCKISLQKYQGSVNGEFLQNNEQFIIGWLNGVELFNILEDKWEFNKIIFFQPSFFMNQILLSRNDEFLYIFNTSFFQVLKINNVEKDTTFQRYYQLQLQLVPVAVSLSESNKQIVIENNKKELTILKEFHNQKWIVAIYKISLLGSFFTFSLIQFQQEMLIISMNQLIQWNYWKYKIIRRQKIKQAIISGMETSFNKNYQLGYFTKFNNFMICRLQQSEFQTLQTLEFKSDINTHSISKDGKLLIVIVNFCPQYYELNK